MHAQDARNWLTDQLRRDGIVSGVKALFDHQGEAVMQSPEGVTCVFRIPERDVRWYLYALIREINPERDGSCLAYALALNLQSALMRGTTLGLNLETRQLILQQSIPIDISTLKVRPVLKHFVECTRKLKEELNKSFTKTAAPTARIVGPGQMRGLPQGLSPRLFT